MFKLRFNGAVSSLDDDSRRRSLGRDMSGPGAPGRGEKLPGALGVGLVGCIVLACFEITSRCLRACEAL